MYHSIIFGDKNTWDDWHLVPSSRPLFLPPNVKINYIDIPGSDGKIDLTNYLTGEPMYENRTGSIEFLVMNGYGDWAHRYSEIMNYLHGQKMKAILEDDPGYYYIGRFSVNKWASEKDRSKITINYDVAPYKISMQSSAEDWLWDIFDFEVGVIREYKDIRVNGVIEIPFYGDRKTEIPTITVSLDDPNGYMIFSQDSVPNKAYTLFDGVNKIPGLHFTKGNDLIRFEGNGNISIDYRGGSL